MRIGIICPSEIAFRRFMPAMSQVKDLSFAGLGVFSREERFGSSPVKEEQFTVELENERQKAQGFIDLYGGKIYESYNDVVSSPEIDAVYIPLPPALHYRWAKKALENGKHVLVEKPSSVSLKDTMEMVATAQKMGLALHENYMFAFHNQLDAINSIIQSGEIGEVRLYRISFGFPRRTAGDFRYNRSLGGGALIDAGGYTIKYATKLLGDSAEIKYAKLNYIDEFDVDIYGSAALVNKDGVTVQIAFGMDNDYQCELEVWGSKGTLRTGRVLTAPAGFVPTVTIKKNTDYEDRALPADDAFKKSIEHFVQCTVDSAVREDNYRTILKQAQMVEQFSEMARK